MNHIKEFSKHSRNYEKYTPIQKSVALHLLSKIKNNPKKILDLGCGTGYIYKNIAWNIEKFIGVDYASGMCELHPKNKEVVLINDDFDSILTQHKIAQDKLYDIVFSSSSLQWSKNIENILKFSATITNHIAFSIFTKNTFKDINNCINIESFLPDVNDLLLHVEKYFAVNYEIKNYRLNFDDTLSMFRYIKQSGVSGGKKKLNYKELKELINTYSKLYLDFEVIYFWSK